MRRRSGAGWRSSTTTGCAAPACGRSATTAVTRSSTGRSPSRSSSTRRHRRSGVRMLATVQGDEGFVVGWAARDTSRVAAYDVQVSVDGGAWRAWQTATRATSDVWLGGDGHGYAFRVRAVDSLGNRGAWNVGATWHASASLVAGGVRPRRRGRPRVPHRAPHELGAARDAAGRDDPRADPRPDLRRRTDLVRGHRADPRVDAGLVRGARRLGRRPVGCRRRT